MLLPVYEHFVKYITEGGGVGTVPASTNIKSDVLNAVQIPVLFNTALSPFSSSTLYVLEKTNNEIDQFSFHFGIGVRITGLVVRIDNGHIT